MRSHEFITELKIDNRKGLGAVPHNGVLSQNGQYVSGPIFGDAK